MDTSPDALDRKTVEAYIGKIQSARQEIAKVIVGQQDIIERLLISIFAGGHCLMVGVPGLAKTLMVNTLAQVLDLKFKRVQFTPDLMPGDITGSEVLEQQPDGAKAFRFVEGPLFANMILADEINRTPPKTQSALLEAMQEHRVTVGNKTYALPEPFFVLATQNPIEQEGTYPLPEAQQDRFMFFLWVDYPELEEEIRILGQTTANRSVALKSILSGADILTINRIVREVPVSEPMVRYAANLARCSRSRRGKEGDASIPDFVRKYLQWGAGPRAGQYLLLGAKARALLNGHTHVAGEDIRAVAHSVLQHRVIVNFAAQADGVTPASLIDMILERVKE